MSKEASDYSTLVILSAFLTPVLGGAVIYYSLKETHSEMAKLGNTMSFIAIAGWILGFGGLGSAGVPIPTYLYQLVGLSGLVLAIITVGLIKKTPPTN